MISDAVSVPGRVGQTLRGTAKYLFLCVLAAGIAFPYMWMLISSFREGSDVFVKDQFFPAVWRWQNYPDAMAMAPFDKFFLNSTITSLMTVFFQLITCPLAAFAFAKLEFKSKNLLFTLFLCTMMIPGESTIISNYLSISAWKLTNTRFAIVAPDMTSMFGIFLLRQLYRTIPDELMEAARIDGARTRHLFWHVALPLGKGALATVAIFAFVGSWNSYLWPTLVTTQDSMRTVQTGLRYMVNPDLGSEWPLIMAASATIIIPVLVLFIGLQKYFVQGISKVGLK